MYVCMWCVCVHVTRGRRVPAIARADIFFLEVGRDNTDGATPLHSADQEWII